MTRHLIHLHFWRSALTLALVLSVGGLTGCMGSKGAASDMNSPTGTYWAPRDGVDGGGYVALDEACEGTDDPGYLDRYETPMFRSVAEASGLAFIVDGSLLWAVDISDPFEPRRLSLTVLDGHPLQVDLTPWGHLVVASGEEGLIIVDVNDATNPAVIATHPVGGDAMDVKVQGDIAYVARGNDGIQLFQLDQTGAATALGWVDLPGFAVAVDVEGDIAWVAACKSLVGVNIADPANPSLIGAYWVPYGHAKDVDAVGDEVYVAGGEALFGYDAAEPDAVIWKGYYDEPGSTAFYVNAVVVSDNVAFIAAGDESVRSIDVSKLTLASGFPAEQATGDEPPPDLAGPEVLSDDNLETVDTWMGDPIGIGIAGDVLMVLGNFRWLGERTLRLLQVHTGGIMTDIGAYVQPRRFIGVSETAGDLMVHGELGLNQIFVSGAATPVSLDLGGPVRRTHVSAEGVYLLLDSGSVQHWTGGLELTEVVGDFGARGAQDLAADGNKLYFSDTNTNTIRTTTSGQNLTTFASGELGFFGWSRLAAADGHVYAYDPLMGRLHTLSAGGNVLDVQYIGLCEAYDIADYYEGLDDSRARLRVVGGQLRLLCPQDDDGDAVLISLSLADPTQPEELGRISLPAGMIVDFAVVNDGIATLRFDNDRYISTLSVSAEGVHHSYEFYGHATGMVAGASSVTVSDGDIGLWDFQLSAGQAPAVTNVTPLD